MSGDAGATSTRRRPDRSVALELGAMKIAIHHNLTSGGA
jgi:hypothetical protein